MIFEILLGIVIVIVIIKFSDKINALKKENESLQNYINNIDLKYSQKNGVL